MNCCSGNFQLFFLDLVSTALGNAALVKAKRFPIPYQVAVRRRSSAWTRTRTHWRRRRRVPVMNFCLSPTGTGPLASSRACQLPARSKVGPGTRKLRTVAKACATKPWPALTSRDAWWIRPSARKPVSCPLIVPKRHSYVDWAFSIKIVAVTNRKTPSMTNNLHPMPISNGLVRLTGSQKRLTQHEGWPCFVSQFLGCADCWHPF